MPADIHFLVITTTVSGGQCVSGGGAAEVRTGGAEDALRTRHLHCALMTRPPAKPPSLGPTPKYFLIHSH
jgi:hypothetical protein